MPGRAKGLHRARVHQRECFRGVHVRARVQLVVDLRGPAFPAHDAQRDHRFALDCGEAPVAARAERDALLRGRAVARVELLALAIHHATHRKLQPPREQRRRVRVRAGRVLRPEAAAHVIADHAHVGVRQLERGGQIVPHAEDSLRALPHDEPVAFPLRHGAVRFHGAVQRTGGAHRDRHRHLSLGQSGLDVATRRDERRVERQVGPRSAHARGAIGHRVVVGHREGGGRDRHAHRAGGGAGLGLRGGAHGGHGLTHVAHVHVEQPRRAAPEGAGDVARGQDVQHAWHRARGARIDRGHAVRCVGAHQLGEDHAGATDVGGVARTARGLLEGIDARDALAHHAEPGIGAPRRDGERRNLDDLGLLAPLDLDGRGDEALALLARGHQRAPSSGGNVPCSPRATDWMAAMIFG